MALFFRITHSTFPAEVGQEGTGQEAGPVYQYKSSCVLRIIYEYEAVSISVLPLIVNLSLGR